MITADSTPQFSEDWVTALMRTPGVSRVLSAGALAHGSPQLPADHMFTAMLKQGMLGNLLCLYDERASPRFYSIVTLGTNVCGHQGIVHGGLTAALIDETLGSLIYILKREGRLGEGPSFTVRLEMDYKKPIPAASLLILTAELVSAEGRKAWATCRVEDRPQGAVYAEGKALFVIPKPQPTA